MILFHLQGYPGTYEHGKVTLEGKGIKVQAIEDALQSDLENAFLHTDNEQDSNDLIAYKLLMEKQALIYDTPASIGTPEFFRNGG